MRVCKLFRKECRTNNRLWYYVNAHLAGKPASDASLREISPMPDFYSMCIEEQKVCEKVTRQKVLK